MAQVKNVHVNNNGETSPVPVTKRDFCTPPSDESSGRVTGHTTYYTTTTNPLFPTIVDVNKK